MGTHVTATETTTEPAAAAPPARRASTLTVVAAAVVLVALVAPLWAELHKVGAPQEEGFMLALPYRALHGDVANRDFVWLYGPASIWVPAAAYAVFGTSVLVARLLGFGFEIATVAAIFLLGLRWSRETATAAGLVAVLFVATKGPTPLPWTAALPVMLLAIVFGARALEQTGTRQARAAFACGAFAGLATVFRLDVAFGMIAVAAIFAWPLAARLRRIELAGFVAGLLPWLAHLATAGPSAVFRGLVLDPLHLRNGNKVPVPPDPHRINGFIESFINIAIPKWPFPRPSAAAQLTWWFFLIVFAIVMTFAVAIWTIRRRRSPRAWILLALAAMSVGLVPSMLQRDDAAHLNNMGAVVFPAAIFALTEVVGAGAGATRSRVLRHGAVGLAALVVVGALTATWTAAAYVDDVRVSLHRRAPGSVKLTHRGRDFYFPASAVPGVRAMLDTVERVSHPGDRLLVGPTDLRRTPYIDSVVYYLLPQLPPATRFVYMNPATALHDYRELADDVASADVL
ncbi:MAG: hypothetical protein QOI55_2927, partial [Actinomycetota bacterium]|nr:hypothetical protein [Actinomycetota bacterium]